MDHTINHDLSPGSLDRHGGAQGDHLAPKARYEALRAELAILLAERIDLAGVVVPNLEAKYAVRLGDLELALLKLDVETRGMKRAIELIQADLNRGKAPDLDRIERLIQGELADWTRNINEKAARLRDAAKTLADPMPAGEWAEIKRLFRRIARRLHPDVNPGLTPDETTIWHRVRDAYERRNLGELQALDLVAGEAPSAPDDISARDLLKRRCDELTARIHDEIRRTEHVKASHGYEKLLLVRDEAWVTARRAELDEKIVKATAWRDALAAEVRQMQEGAGHRQPRAN